MWTLVVLSALVACWTWSGEAALNTTLSFAYITSKTGTYVAGGAIPMVDLALELINSRADILSNYTLTYHGTVGNSNCTRTGALNEFAARFLQSKDSSRPTYVSLLCCGCASSTVAVAEISHYWNIPQVAGVAGTPELNDRQRYRGVYSTDATVEYIGHALVAVAREFSWSQAVCITQLNRPFIDITQKIESEFLKDLRVLDTRATFQAGSLDSVRYDDVLKWEADYRIVIINANDLFIYEILCRAYAKGMQSPRYVWITPGWYGKQWWLRHFTNTSCNVSTVERMLNNSLTFNPKGNMLSDNRTKTTVSHLTPEQYEMEYIKKLQWNQRLINSGTVFDAVWAMALALNRTAERVVKNDSSGCSHLPGQLVPLEQFDYSNQRMGCVMMDSYARVKFTGITGPVAFNNKGSRDLTSVRINQMRIGAPCEHEVNSTTFADSERLSERTVMEAVVNRSSGNVTLFKAENTSTIWPDGVPYDGSLLYIIYYRTLAQAVIAVLLAFGGIGLSILLMLYNYKCWKTLSSLSLSEIPNYILCLGALVLYLSEFLHNIAFDIPIEAYTAVCNIRQWLFCLGFTTCLSVILAKTAQLWYVLREPGVPAANKKYIDLKYWLYLIGIVVGIEVGMLILFTALPVTRLEAMITDHPYYPTITIVHELSYHVNVYVCSSSYVQIFFFVSYLYKFVLLAAAMFFTCHNRGLPAYDNVVNDSAEMLFCIFWNAIILGILAVSDYALSYYPDVLDIIYSICLLTEAALFLFCTFGPAAYRLCTTARDKRRVAPQDAVAELSMRRLGDLLQQGSQDASVPPRRSDPLTRSPLATDKHDKPAGETSRKKD